MLRRLALPLMWLAIWTQVAWGQVAFDAATTGTALNTNTLTFSHTVGAGGTNRLLTVGVSFDNRAVTGVTYAGTAMTNIGTAANAPASASLWRLTAPATGANDVAITMNGGGVNIVGCAISLTGVDQTTPVGTGATATGATSPATVNVSSATDEMVVDIVGVENQTATAGAGQTDRCNALADINRGAGSTEAGAGTVTMSWTLGADAAWAIVGVSAKVAAAGGPPARMRQGIGR